MSRKVQNMNNANQGTKTSIRDNLNIDVYLEIDCIESCNLSKRRYFE